jgi:protein SCO1/2
MRLNSLLPVAQSVRTRRILSGILILAIFAAGYVIGTTAIDRLVSPAPSHQADTPTASGGAGLVDPPYRVPDFTLTSQTGDPISLSDLRGKAVLFFFGYTHCPDECPTTLADFTRVKQELGDAADQVDFVFISIDGARDTPDVVAAYLRSFDASFIGMTGDAATLQQVGQTYGLVFAREQAAAQTDTGHETENHTEDLPGVDNYFLQHTSPSFLVDSSGYLRTVFFYRTDPNTIAARIRQIIQ